jgi:hypothetical protein
MQTTVFLSAPKEPGVVFGRVDPGLSIEDVPADSARRQVARILSIDVDGPTAPLLGWIVMRAARKNVPLEGAGLKRRSEQT